MRPDRSNFLNQCHNSGAENQKINAGHIATPIWKSSSQSLNTGKKDTIPSIQTLYRVQTGAFSKRSNAESFAAKLKTEEFATYIVQVDNLYKVQVGAFAQKANLLRVIEHLGRIGMPLILRIRADTAIGRHQQDLLLHGSRRYDLYSCHLITPFAAHTILHHGQNIQHYLQTVWGFSSFCASFWAFAYSCWVITPARSISERQRITKIYWRSYFAFMSNFLPNTVLVIILHLIFPHPNDRLLKILIAPHFSLPP